MVRDVLVGASLVSTCGVNVSGELPGAGAGVDVGWEAGADCGWGGGACGLGAGACWSLTVDLRSRGRWQGTG